jgi:hypothetical protein
LIAVPKPGFVSSQRTDASDTSATAAESLPSPHLANNIFQLGITRKVAQTVAVA